MSVLDVTRRALTDAIQLELPLVTVSAAPLAEDTPLKEAIWFESAVSEFDWKRLGGPSSRSKDEDVTIELRVHVYRESSRQTDAALAALARIEELYQAIETAALTVRHEYGFIRRWRVTPRPAENGWVVDGFVTFEGHDHP